MPEVAIEIMAQIKCTWYILLILQFTATCFATTLAEDEGPLVLSKVGPIRGLRASDGDYNMFLGIPYGKIDKTKPFGRAVPHPNFNKTFKAFDDSAVCPQKEEFNHTIVGTLDCLTLHIYVPTSATPINRLPVLVFIFGGSLQSGSAGRYIFGPKFLIKQNIILITINYRLGPYGFMCLDNPEVPGNQGIKDQRLALRWINQNIEAFSADVNKITLSGQSAGSMSADLQIHAPSEMLFQQAILESGTILTPLLFLNPGKDGLLKLTKYVGFDTDDESKALSYLATVDTKKVIAATESNNLTFRVCVEKSFDNVEPIVTDYPVNLLAPKLKNITTLIGFNNDEEIRTYGAVDANLNGNDFITKYIKALFDFDNCTFNEIKTVMKHFYFGDDEVNMDTRRQITDLASDLEAGYPVLRSLRKYFASGARTIFSYLFSYVGQRNYEKYQKNISIGRAAHGDEIGYLYDVDFFKSFMSEEDVHMIDTMTTLWTNFVKYGNPTPETTELLPVKWNPVTRDRWNYLLIDTDLAMGSRPFHKRMSFHDLLFKAYEKYLIGYFKKECNTCDVNQL